MDGGTPRRLVDRRDSALVTPLRRRASRSVQPGYRGGKHDRYRVRRIRRPVTSASSGRIRLGVEGREARLGSSVTCHGGAAELSSTASRNDTVTLPAVHLSRLHFAIHVDDDLVRDSRRRRAVG